MHSIPIINIRYFMLPSNYAIVAHGGIGKPCRKRKEHLIRAVDHANNALIKNGINPSFAAIDYMESSGAFNAGIGSHMISSGCAENEALFCINNAVGAVSNLISIISHIIFQILLKQHTILQAKGCITVSCLC
jgi:isoaspartyl peptidase/L-asparaginase-like protein (Ntn-hydrolase superfamily)